MIRFPLVLAFILSALALVACGGGGAPSASSPQPAAATRPAEGNGTAGTVATPAGGSAADPAIAAGKPVVYWVHTDW